MAFEKHLRKANVPEETIQAILGQEEEPQEGTQAYADYMARVLQKCEALLEHDVFCAAMLDRACCKSGYRLNNARQLHKEHGDKALAQRVQLLGELKYMGKPALNETGEIEAVAVGSHGHVGMQCPCWRVKGFAPESGPMPLSYCACCGGHFLFHYQKALGLKLRLKEVVSSILNSGGSAPCVFRFEIMEK